MAKQQAAPDQLTFPGVDLDLQNKFDFALPAGKRAQWRKNGAEDESHLPPNLGQPVRVEVPDFADPNRPKTCLEVDFPIVPINALSILEGNAGKPIYQMSKWWARRRSCVFRAMLIAAAMQAPFRKHADGSPVLDENGRPVPDDTEAAKAVWDVYYANHQAAGTFKQLKVLDCFMGGGTTLVEGSRLGFQVTGVDLNPVAWFVVKNELACTDPAEVKAFFDRIEVEVKPLIQPFYVTDCPRGHKGRWFDVATGKPVGDGRRVGIAHQDHDGGQCPPYFDPATLPPDERKRYRYEGPEIIYTFWAKHGPCTKPGCGHRTPVFRSPVIAEKKLGVKFISLVCKSCKSRFHAELGSARMAPAAERVVLDGEGPFTELSQPFARLLSEYGQGNKDEKRARAAELFGMVEDERGLCCPKCGAFAGQYLRDVLNNHRQAQTAKAIEKKDLKIEPARNSTKPVYCYLLIHPDWLKGSPGTLDGEELGGYADAPVEATARWYRERLKNLSLIEVRGRIRLADDTSALGGGEVAADAPESDDAEEGVAETEGEDRKTYGLPQFVTLADGRKVDTRKGTVPKQSHFTCGACGQEQDLREALQAGGHGAPVAVYALQGYSPKADAEGHIYGGRFFAAPSEADIARLIHAEREWYERRDADLKDCWPREEIPHTYMTHHANFALPNQGYTHWWKMFNTRQLLVHTEIMRFLCQQLSDTATKGIALQALGAEQQYLRNQCMFAFWHQGRDHFAPHFGNPNYAPKNNVVEVGLWTKGYGSWTSTISSVIDGTAWAVSPWEPVLGSVPSTKSERLLVGDPVQPLPYLICRSASDIDLLLTGTIDLVITDPPFGDNLFYSDLANFFHAWLRLALKEDYPELFGPTQTPNAQEALAPRLLPDEEANEYYRVRLAACWTEACRVLKDGGILAFTFHHSELSQWAIVLDSLFEAGFVLVQTFPIASDEMKGEGGQFGAKGTEHDIIHVCRKRLEPPTRVSWAKMRQWVKAELTRLRRLLEAYRSRELSEADIRVILRGKALEFFSRHYRQVYSAEDVELSMLGALQNIEHLLDEDTASPGERPPSLVVSPGYDFLNVFGSKASLPLDDVRKRLLSTGTTLRVMEDLGWLEERAKVVHRVPIAERFTRLRQRPRKEMKTEIDQAHFLIGAALPASGVNLENELAKNTWIVRRTVEAVLVWYSQTAVEPEIREAASLAATLLRRSIEERRTQLRDEQGVLFDAFEEE
jgi:putative DNA methylase